MPWGPRAFRASRADSHKRHLPASPTTKIMRIDGIKATLLPSLPLFRAEYSQIYSRPRVARTLEHHVRHNTELCSARRQVRSNHPVTSAAHTRGWGLESIEATTLHALTYDRSQTGELHLVAHSNSNILAVVRSPVGHCQPAAKTCCRTNDADTDACAAELLSTSWLPTGSRRLKMLVLNAECKACINAASTCA